MIICTHWHDDHIKGMGELLNRCDAAIFSIARTTARKKFLRLVGLDDSSFKASTSSTVEINKCFKIIESRKSVIREAMIGY
jgi:glyoxylase-like metal-dependent hydrolase (beta-lactamase superfamily II)